MSSIGILGAGTWGIALARMLTNCGHNVVVWSAIASEIDDLIKTHKHKNLEGVEIPLETKFTKSIEEVCTCKDIILFAVPSPYVRTTARTAKPYIPENQIIVDVAKGIETDTLLTLTQVIRSEIDKPIHLVALSGPTHAEEVSKDMPSTIVSACEEIDIAKKVQDIFMNSCLRVYTNPDVQGVELCGAVKNVIAIAVGIATGLECGDNTKAALITRGMSEICSIFQSTVYDGF